MNNTYLLSTDLGRVEVHLLLDKEVFNHFLQIRAFVDIHSHLMYIQLRLISQLVYDANGRRSEFQAELERIGRKSTP